MVKITRNISSKSYLSFVPIYEYMVSGVRFQVSAKQLAKKTARLIDIETSTLLESLPRMK